MLLLIAAAQLVDRYPVAPRTILLHMHIFKNGGTTIDSVLEREFYDLFASLHGPSPESVLTERDVIGLLEEHPGIEAVSSHHLRYPKPDVDGFRFVDICMLRHPLDRLHSMYRYFRSTHSSEYALKDLARELECGPFFRECLTSRRGLVENAQVAFLAGTASHADTRSSFVRALARIPEIDLLGTTDLFDESLVTWEYLLYPMFPGIGFHFSPQNVTRAAAATLEDRLEQFRTSCGEDVYDELAKLNEEDLALYGAATREVQRRFFERPLSHKWLAQFRVRNLRLEYLQKNCLKARCRQWIGRRFPRSSPLLERSLSAIEPKPAGSGARHFFAKSK